VYKRQFQVQTGTIALQLNADHSISGADARGNPVFTLARPWMWDNPSANGVPSQSTAIGVMLTGANGLYTVAFTPDLTWLQNPARKYPVTIDPTITFQNNVSNTEGDTHVDSSFPDSNYYGVTRYDGVGNDPSVGWMRTWFQFSPTMSDGRYASSATVNMWQYTTYNSQRGNSPVAYDAHAVSGSWNLSTITWNNQPTIGGVLNTQYSRTTAGWVSWDVTSQVQQWEQHNADPSLGIMIRAANESVTWNTSELFYSDVCGTGNCGSSSYHPYLQINYDDWLYTISSAALPGQGTWVPSGGTASAQVVVQNTGTATWDSTVRLSYRWLQNGTDISGGFTPRALLPSSVLAGNFAVYNFQLAAPSQVTGLIQLQFAMMHDLTGSFPSFQSIAWSAYPAPNGKADVTYFNGGAEVPIAPESYTMVGRNAPPLLVAQAGSLITVPITLTNTDKSTLFNYTWQASNHADLTQVGIRSIRRSDGSTVGSMAARTYLPQDVAPGASVNVDPVFQAPGDPGDYQLRLDLVRTNKAKDATVTGGAKLGVADALSPYAGTALQFDGSTGYVQLPAGDFNGWPNANAYAVELWFKTTGSGVLLGQTNGTLPNNSTPSFVPALYVDTAGALRAEVFYHGSSTTQLVATGPYWDGKWHHVVDVYNVGTETLYVDCLLYTSPSPRD